MILTLDQMSNLYIEEVINLYRIGYRLEESPRIISLVDPTVDPVINFGKVTVSTGYTSSATSIVLTSGDGSKLPDPTISGDFNLVWWNYTDYPDPSDDPNKEIVRCTANSTDTLTITRAQEGTSASNKNTSGKTYKMVLTLTAKTISDLQTDAQNKVNTHAAVTSSVHNFDSSGNAPAQSHGSSRHTGTIGSWAQIDKTTSDIADITTKSHTSLTDIGTNTHTAIDTHISSYTEVHGISAGLDAAKPGTPVVGQRYIAVDTQKDYECYVAGTWRDVTATHAALTASVHGFDASGNAPPQLHGLASHTGTIGSTNMVSEGTNLYYTDARARAAISNTAPITYSSSTGAIGITQAGTSSNGYLSSTDWNTFNGKASSLGYTPVNKAGDSMSGNLTVNAQYASAKITTTTAVNWNSGNVQSMTLANGGNSFSFSNGISGGRYMLILASGGASTTATWTGVKWPNATPPTLSTTAGRIDIVTFVYDGTNYYGNISFNYY